MIFNYFFKRCLENKYQANNNTSAYNFRIHIFSRQNFAKDDVNDQAVKKN